MEMDNKNEIETETEAQDETANDSAKEPVTDAAASPEKESVPKKITASLFDIFEMFAICTAVILLLFSYATRLTVVEGESMEDTLHDEDYLIVQDIGYTPARGDIVVIHKIDAQPYHNPIIKRVIAIEGDTVDIDFDSWTVYVNGEALDEPYVNLDPGHLYCEQDLPLTVEEGKVFVLGDHRNHSADSRTKQLGQIDERCVIGRAVLRILPIEKFGFMERAKYE